MVNQVKSSDQIMDHLIAFLPGDLVFMREKSSFFAAVSVIACGMVSVSSSSSSSPSSSEMSRRPLKIWENANFIRV